MNVEYFITVVAWIFLVWGILGFTLIGLADYTYNCTKRGQLDKMLLNMKGREKTFSYRNHFLMIVVTFAWLMVYYF